MAYATWPIICIISRAKMPRFVSMKTISSIYVLDARAGAGARNI